MKTRTYTYETDVEMTVTSGPTMMLKLEITYSVIPGVPGSSTEPSEPAQVNIWRIRLTDFAGKRVDVPARLSDLIEDHDGLHAEIMAGYRSQVAYERDDAADHKRQMRKEAAE